MAGVAVAEDVAASTVAVDDAGVAGVKVVKALKERPLLERFDGDVLVAVEILAKARRVADLSDEVQHASVVVEPDLVEAYDVVTMEGAEKAHLDMAAVDHGGVQRAQAHPVPRHLDALLLVEPS